jgi:hypothetical protein
MNRKSGKQYHLEKISHKNTTFLGNFFTAL